MHRPSNRRIKTRRRIAASAANAEKFASRNKKIPPLSEKATNVTKALASSYDVTSSSFKAALDPGGPLFEVLIGEAEISLDGEDQIMVRDVMVHGERLVIALVADGHCGKEASMHCKATAIDELLKALHDAPLGPSPDAVHVPPQMAVGSSEPPQMVVGSSEPPQMAVGSSEPPQMAVGSSEPPQMAVGSSEPPQMAVGSSMPKRCPISEAASVTGMESARASAGRPGSVLPGSFADGSHVRAAGRRAFLVTHDEVRASRTILMTTDDA